MPDEKFKKRVTLHTRGMNREKELKIRLKVTGYCDGIHFLTVFVYSGMKQHQMVIL
jgi:hypothetical protein